MNKDLWGRTPDELAIERIKEFEPPEGYYLAFSGGKDSVCLYDLTERSGVKFDAHYSVTTCDPPELIYFMREHYPQVHWERPKESIFKAISHRGFPLRRWRWCCGEYKEAHGKDRVVLVGSRAAESPRRKNSLMIRQCFEKHQTIISPILDWKDGDVWDYINERALPYCELYDQGWDRLGCVICPFERKVEMAMKRWPRMFEVLKKSFQTLYDSKENCQARWSSSEEMYNWWLDRDAKYPTKDEQNLNLFDEQGA